mmetsp:Transcript_1468/g.3439  ORF Transcript_1468/g.3439 Transcript_1468/m.3439 type:complete len:316 (+) Transcript_1468:198-1145(+)
MHVGLHVDVASPPPRLRQVVVHHERHRRHVNATCEHVGRDEHLRDAGPELPHDPVPASDIDLLGSLFLCAADKRHRVALLLHPLRQLEGHRPRVHEDDALPDVQRPIKVGELLELPVFVLTDVDVRLCDGGQREILLFHRDVIRPGYHALCEALHVLGPRRREEQDLHLLGQHGADLQDLRTHLVVLVDHHVRLVDHEDAAPTAVDDALLDEVLQLAGRADDDLRGHLTGRPLLLRHGEKELRPSELAQLLDDVVVLSRELASGAHADAGHAVVAEVGLDQHREGKGSGLAGAILGLTDDVAAFQGDRQGPLLDL